MKRIDMASGEPAQFTTLPKRSAIANAAAPAIAEARNDQFYEPAMSEAEQVDVTYAFWTSLFARPQAELRQRLIELDGLHENSDDAVEQSKLDAASHAIEFVLRTKAAMPDAGATLI